MASSDMKDAKDVVSLHEDAVDAAAAAATEEEHALTVKQALITYRPAVLWSFAIALVIVMEGYDTILIQPFFAYPSFDRKYGEYNAQLDETVISFTWQIAFGMGTLLGQTIGVFIGGLFIERFGVRKVIMGGMCVLAGTIFCTFFAETREVLLAGQILNGLPLGAFASIGSIYISEVCPTVLRAFSLSFINACWVVGQLLAAGVLQGLVSNTTDWGFRIPFAVQWVWVIPLAILAFLAPESPWWLIRKGRIEDAATSIRRLTFNLTDQQLEQHLAIMKHTNELELSLDTKARYRDCFTPLNRWRTEIACVVLASQAIIGQAFAYNGTFFFVQAGLSPEVAYKLNLGSTGIALVMTFLSWWFMSAAGRRPLLIFGYSVLAVLPLVIGCLDFAAKSSGAAKWVQAGCTIAWLAVYTGFVGPETFTVAGEASATRVRVYTLSIGRNVYYLVSVAFGVINSYLINPTGGGWKGKCGFLWFSTTVMVLIWAIFRLPETKGWTYEELDILFARGLPAWKFKGEVVDAVGEARGTVEEVKKSE